MCGAGGFLFTVNIVHICQELCQTQSASQSSQLVFSGQIFDLEQNDKMTSDFCHCGSVRIFRLRHQLGGREAIIEFTSKACSALGPVMGSEITNVKILHIRNVFFIILIVSKSCFSPRPIT